MNCLRSYRKNLIVFAAGRDNFNLMPDVFCQHSRSFDPPSLGTHGGPGMILHGPKSTPHPVILSNSVFVRVYPVLFVVRFPFFSPTSAFRI
jgi:hypothetical protein